MEETKAKSFQQKTTLRERKARISRTKGHLSKRTAFVREIVKEVAGYVVFVNVVAVVTVVVVLAIPVPEPEMAVSNPTDGSSGASG